MTDSEEREDLTDSDEDDTGLLGGGGPAATLDEMDGPEDEELHLADGDHDEL